MAPGSGTRRAAIVLAFCAVTAAAGIACRRTGDGSARRDAEPPPEASARAAPRARFVGAASCRPCHQKEFDLWTGSDHQLAMQTANAESVRGNFANTSFEHYGVVSRFSRRDGKYYVRTDGPDGRLADFEVQYTFGVRPLQQYLLALSGGRLQALNVCWDARPAALGGQRWFHLYPKEAVPHGDPFHWTGPYQNWNFMCAECHSTDVAKNYRPETDSYETRFSEISVACEACHGPGSEHNAWADAVRGGRAQASDPKKGLAVLLADRSGSKWEFDMQRGIAGRSAPRTSESELQTCARCHSRRGVIREDYEFGHPLMDTHRPALLSEPLYYADGQIRDEVYEYGSFLQSRMYRRGVTCSDCHDPHALKVAPSPDAACSRCHLREKFDQGAHHNHRPGSAGASCVGCHMPTRNYMVVDARRDHSFRKPRPDLTSRVGSPNACNGCHRDKSVEWAKKASAKWWPDLAQQPHYGLALHAGRERQAGAEAALAALAADEEQPAIVRASAVELLGGWGGGGARAALERALRDLDPLVRAAAIPPLAGLPEGTRRALLLPLLGDPVRVVRIDAARGLATIAAEALPAEEKARLLAGLREYREAQQANLDRAEGRMNLGTLAYETGRRDEARAEYEAALRVNRWFVPAYVNLADLSRMQGKEADAEAMLRRGLETVPDSADLHHALGLSLVRGGRLPPALASLEKAVELEPGNPRYAYVYAVALKEAGQLSRALEVLEKAHKAHSADRDLLIALATFNASAGARGPAAAWARKLVGLDPLDGQAQALLRSIESTRN